jgi:N-acetylglucosaminyldiphosphoundecaprenol N-acetyl-beta-D-mannosaminyltransferase
MLPSWARVKKAGAFCRPGFPRPVRRDLTLPADSRRHRANFAYDFPALSEHRWRRSIVLRETLCRECVCLRTVLSRRGELAIETHPIGGLEFQSIGPNAAAELVVELASTRTGVHVHLANAYTIALADRDDAYRQLINRGVAFADGKPITWVSRLARHKPRIQQVRGPQFFLDVLDIGRSSGVRHFLLGSTDGLLDLMRARLAERFEGIEIVGSYSPPFRPLTADETAAQDELIRQSDADVVWVGLGTPKQDIEAARLALSTTRPAVAVGAAFDFAAGNLRVAPIWMQRAGLEWSFRLASEPRRLWRRYLFGNLRFVWAVVRRR